MKIETTQNLGRMVSLGAIKGFLKRLFDLEAVDEEWFGGRLYKAFRRFTVGLRILKSLLVENDFTTRLFTLIVLCLPFLFAFAVLPIIAFFNLFLPASLALRGVSFAQWLSILEAIPITSLIWAGIMSIRIFIRWHFYR